MDWVFIACMIVAGIACSALFMFRYYIFLLVFLMMLFSKRLNWSVLNAILEVGEDQKTKLLLQPKEEPEAFPVVYPGSMYYVLDFKPDCDSDVMPPRAMY
jgi:hypothetical protein